MNSPKSPNDFWSAMKTYKFLLIYIAVIVTIQIVLRLAGWE